MSRLVSRCALALFALVLTVPAASAQSRVRAGLLECHGATTVSFIVGSMHQLDCIYRPSRGRPWPYGGVIRRVGLDVGVTERSTLTWAVLAPTRRIGPGDLAGTYSGPTAGVAVGVGANANALVGGSANALALQPLALEGQTGLNIALGIASLELRYGDEPSPRMRRHRHRHAHG
jgi:hypothetical protein